MGSKCSSSVCDICQHQITNEIVCKFAEKDNIIHHGRFCDEGFIIFHDHGPETKINEMFAVVNSHHPLLKFTYESSTLKSVFSIQQCLKEIRFQSSLILDF